MCLFEGRCWFKLRGGFSFTFSQSEQIYTDRGLHVLHCEQQSDLDALQRC